MNQLLMFSVYDSKATAFITPFFSPTTATAVRAFAAAANDHGHEFGRYAGDYTLFCIGTFDSESGKITPSNVQENLGTALSHTTTKEIAINE